MMYVLQALTGQELDIQRELARMGYSALVPRELRREHRQGAWHEKERLLIPGYLFIDIHLSDKDYYRIKSVPGIIRFLGVTAPEPLARQEADYISWLSGYGSPLEPSLLSVGESVSVLAGPLKGQEARIISVDKHQRRATVSITLLGQEHRIKLSIDLLTTT